MTAIIEMQNLTVRLGNRIILDPLNGALSGRCIGLLGPNGFLSSEGSYSDNKYINKTVKTIAMHDPKNYPSGGFAWLRWKGASNSGNSTETADMLAGPGNLSEGFTEAAWPDKNNLNLPKPTGYPIYPHELSGGDWISSNTGVGNGSDVRAALDFHKKNKTVMNLPIFDVLRENRGSIRVVGNCFENRELMPLLASVREK